MHRRLVILCAAGVLLLAAAAWASLARGGGTASTALLAAAAALWSLAVLLSWRSITRYLARRSTRYGLNALLLSLLVAVLLFLVGMLGERHAWRRDLSATGEFTLSEKTLNVLEGIAKNIEVYVYFEEAARDAVRDLLVEYSRRNRGIHVHMEDLNENPELAERYGVTQLGTIVLDAGDKVVRLLRFSEEDLTNGLIKVSRPGQKRVYFLTDHGEKAIDDKGIFGYATATAALQRENYATTPLSLAQAREVPRDCDLLVVGGAKSSLLDQEVQAIIFYLQRGGRLFCLFDPRFRTNLEGYVGRWGIHVGEDIVVDPSPAGQLLTRGNTTPLASQYGAHAITRQFRDPTYFQGVRSVRRLQLYQGRAETAELVFTGPQSWAETDVRATSVGFDAADLRGPVAVGMASRLDVEGLAPELEPAVSAVPGQEVQSGEALQGAGKEGGTEARLVVFGDSDFANNQNFNDMGNGNLFLNCVAWLTEDEDLIALRPKPAQVRSVTMTLAEVRVLNLIAIAVLPGLVAGVGVIATLQRRARG
jgi:ABC-type uncharacterized transport system involved in gliding motility auxiliary subunit